MSAGRPSILYVASHWPLGRESYGAQQRTLQIGRALKRYGDVRLVIGRVDASCRASRRATEREFDVARVDEFASTPVRGPRARLRHAFDSREMNTGGHAAAEAARHKLHTLVDDADVTWVHTIRLANAYRRWRWPRSVLDVDDFTSQYFVTEADDAARFRGRLLARYRASMWTRRESRLPERFDRLVVCSERDRARSPDPDRTVAIPNGFADVPTIPPLDPGAPYVGVIGKMSYEPNRNGVQWFLDHIWREVLTRHPRARFRIVGADCDPSWAAAPNVDVLGYVDDTEQEMAAWALTVVPVHVGAGTRVKIAEAFARGVPVLSTTLGAFGYEVTSGRELLLADTPDVFAADCVRLIDSAELRQQLRDAGRRYFAGRLSTDAQAERVRETLAPMLEARSR